MKKLLSSPVMTVLLFVLAVGLIGYGGINGIQAAPRIESRAFGAQIELADINTALVENGTAVKEKRGVLLTDLVPKDEKFQIGTKYDEHLAVQNTGNIDEYVRVTVYRYWTDKTGKQLKDTSLKPEYIELGLTKDSGWSVDEAASTDERVVLYYSGVLAPGDTSNDFLESVTISPKVITAISNVDGTANYQYDGVTFQIKATVDAVQTHNETEAMTSAWGRTN